VTEVEQRAQAAALMRELGHDFVARRLDEDQLRDVAGRLRDLVEIVRSAPARSPMTRVDGIKGFQHAVAGSEPAVKHRLLSDSIVSGGANPLGLGAELWREDDSAFMRVTLGKAFEGAPGRAHGGILAALLDETMGLVNAMSGVLAYTVQLDITYLAPAPIDEPITSHATMVTRDGRKITVEGVVEAGELTIARATGLFITVDADKFLAHLGLEGL
jgi:acyl-coenzyme A thioesterase PaaI-like protein